MTPVPEHEVEITLPRKALINADATIVVKSDGKKLGEMQLSKGGLDWKSARRRGVKSIAWERVADLLDGA